MDDAINEAVLHSLMFAKRGPFAGSVVRVLDGWASGNMLVTTHLFCDKPIRPGDVLWYAIGELRPLTEMELIGTMAL